MVLAFRTNLTRLMGETGAENREQNEPGSSRRCSTASEEEEEEEKEGLRRIRRRRRFIDKTCERY